MIQGIVRGNDPPLPVAAGFARTGAMASNVSGYLRQACPSVDNGAAPPYTYL